MVEYHLDASLSMKLPLDLVLVLFRPRNPDLDESFLEEDPARQKSTEAMRRQAIAPQMKPKASWPSVAV